MHGIGIAAEVTGGTADRAGRRRGDASWPCSSDAAIEEATAIGADEPAPTPPPDDPIDRDDLPEDTR